MKPKDIILIKSNFINSSLQLICHVPNRFGHGSLMARTCSRGEKYLRWRGNRYRRNNSVYDLLKKKTNFLICLQLLGGGDLRRIINISYLQEFIKPRTNEMMAFRTFEQKGLGN